MVDYGRVRSTVKPEPIVIDEFSVWQHTDIQEISENVGEENATWFSTARTNLFCNRQRTMRRCSSRSQIHSLRCVKSMN